MASRISIHPSRRYLSSGNKYLGWVCHDHTAQPCSANPSCTFRDARAASGRSCRWPKGQPSAHWEARRACLPHTLATSRALLFSRHPPGRFSRSRPPHWMLELKAAMSRLSSPGGISPSSRSSFKVRRVNAPPVELAEGDPASPSASKFRCSPPRQIIRASMSTQSTSFGCSPVMERLGLGTRRPPRFRSAPLPKPAFYISHEKSARLTTAELNGGRS